MREVTGFIIPEVKEVGTKEVGKPTKTDVEGFIAYLKEQGKEDLAKHVATNLFADVLNKVEVSDEHMKKRAQVQGYQQAWDDLKNALDPKQSIIDAAWAEMAKRRR